MIGLYCEASDRNSEFEAKADCLNLPIISTLADELPPYLLTLTDTRWELRQSGKKAPGPIFVDFVSGQAAHRRKFGGGKGQALAKAVGFKSGHIPSIVDATAGMGKDAFVMASLGAQVTLLERNPIVATLLEDGLKRAMADADTGLIAQRMTLLHGNAIERLQDWPHAAPEIIYLDPMFPPRGKSAQVKKDMKAFHEVVGKDTDAAELLNAARQLATKRVTVKRPTSAEPIAEIKPNAAVTGKTTRYDLYLPV